MLERVVRDREFPEFRAASEDPGFESRQEVVPEDEGVQVPGPVGEIVRSDVIDLKIEEKMVIDTFFEFFILRILRSSNKLECFTSLTNLN